MNLAGLGEAIVVVGVFAVVASLAGLFLEVTVPLGAEELALVGVGVIIVGEILLLKG